jgi:energy-converting hydrogenase Eha subunit A
MSTVTVAVTATATLGVAVITALVPALRVRQKERPSRRGQKKAAQCERFRPWFFRCLSVHPE